MANKELIEDLRAKSIPFFQRKDFAQTKVVSLLFQEIIKCDEYLELCIDSPQGNPPVMSLVAAIHYIIIEKYEGVSDHPYASDLLKFFPSLSPPEEYQQLNDETSSSFSDYLHKFLSNSTTKEKLSKLVKENAIQTNEVRRCANLLPAYLSVIDELTKRNQQADLVEFGCSAGLCLLWDAYSYSYTFTDANGEEKTVSLYPQHSTELERSKQPIIESTVNGKLPPNLPFTQLLINAANSNDHRALFPSLIHSPNHRRVGLDLNLLNLLDKHQERWFKALIWPEGYDIRVNRFNNAFEILQRYRDRCSWIQGNAIPSLSQVLSPNNNNENNDKERATILVHSYAMYQLSEEAKDEVEKSCCEASKYRDIYRISCDIENVIKPSITELGSHVHLFIYRGGERVFTKILMSTQSHGNYFQFLSDDLVY